MRLLFKLFYIFAEIRETWPLIMCMANRILIQLYIIAWGVILLSFSTVAQVKITTTPITPRTVGADKNIAFTVKAQGNNLTYQWYRSEAGGWVAMSNGGSTSSSPGVSGAAATTLTLIKVPRVWDGRKIKVVVTGDGGSDEAEVVLNVKDCFKITAGITMGKGIIPNKIPGTMIDGRYCIGTEMGLHATVTAEGGKAIENPTYKWTINGTQTLYTNSDVLWLIPQYWEYDMMVRVSVCCDGSCDTVSSKYLKMEARAASHAVLNITTPNMQDSYCPGEEVHMDVTVTNVDSPTYRWYVDLVDKGVAPSLSYIMGQNNASIQVVLEPSTDACFSGSLKDELLLKVKSNMVIPTLHIASSSGGGKICQGDEVLLQAVYTNAGNSPSFQWHRGIWDLGTGDTAKITVDRNMWVKCEMKAGSDVCFNTLSLIDSMYVDVMGEVGVVTIQADMAGKKLGDELVFSSAVENILGTLKYEWYVNSVPTGQSAETYISNTLHDGDIVECMVSGGDICQVKVVSNQIVLDFPQQRDTIIEVSRGKSIKNMSLSRSGDGGKDFILTEPAMHGQSGLTLDGKFGYTPNSGFVGNDSVKYIIREKLDETRYDEGAIYITVREASQYRVPNIITPNGDGKNDVWVLGFIANFPDHLITVYDRGGRIVFQARNYQNDWDGTGNNKSGYIAYYNLTSGVYTYVIELGDRDKTVLKSWLEIRSDLKKAK